MALQSGQVVDNRYRVVKILGQGGMGAVYRCWDLRLNRPVALKEMLAQPGLDDELLGQLLQQFEAEAQTLATLVHPNLVRVTDYFFWEHNQYLVMDFVEGENLAERIRKHGAQSEVDLTKWAVQLLSALDYCHKRGILHRDIKPQNILIDPEGDAVLVDFGLVKLWDPNDPHTKTVMRGAGTPEYAPPEQYDMGLGHTDPRSDIYALGATLYHAATGRIPPTATQRMANPAGFTRPRQLNAGFSAEGEHLILRAMSVAIPERFQSAIDMKEAFQALSNGKVSSPSQLIQQKTQVVDMAGGPGEGPGGTVMVGPGRPGTTPPPAGMQSRPGTYPPPEGMPRPGTYPPPAGMAARPGTYPPPTGMPYTAAPPRKRKSAWGLWIAIGLVILLCIGGSIAGLSGLAWLGSITLTPTARGDNGITTATATATTVAPTAQATAQIFTVNPRGIGDYTSLAEAVTAVPAGSQLSLAAGDFVLDAPLEINKPLILAGAGMDRTFIIFAGKEYVVSYTGGGLLEARDLTFRHDGDAEADVVYVTSGEILFDACRFTGAVYVDGNTPRAGLHLAGGVTGRVQNSEAIDNNLDGFRLVHEAQVDLIDNSCRNNQQFGIQLRDSSGGEIKGNQCTDNTLSGISITGNAAPTLLENIIRNNGESGLVYWENANGVARFNTIENNGLHGISINTNATPTLEDNTIRANTQSGLAYFGESSGEARRNQSIENGLHGIGLNGQARPTLEENICSNNTEVGIRFGQESSGTARKNECNNNGLSGIVVTGSATPTLLENSANDNIENGIVYFGTSTGLARGNQFWRNGLSGMGCSENSAPTLEDNISAENESAGIRIADDSTPQLNNNTFHHNMLSGILIRDQAQPVLERNNTYANTESGIVYFGESGGAARYNTCSENEMHGISVKDNSAPTLENNTLSDNVEAGLAYFEQASGIARQNQIKGNYWGIYVTATANPSLIGNTVSNNVTDIDDRR